MGKQFGLGRLLAGGSVDPPLAAKSRRCLASVGKVLPECHENI
jgi:hypothetical protein